MKQNGVEWKGGREKVMEWSRVGGRKIYKGKQWSEQMEQRRVKQSRVEQSRVELKGLKCSEGDR